MKLVVLAGGRGARLGDLSERQPKSMLPVLGRPIVHRVIDHAMSHGCREAVVALGYRADDVRSYFDDRPDVEHVAGDEERWCSASADRVRVRTIDTGVQASKVERLLAIRPLIGDETFVLAYCDALSDIDLAAMVRFHRDHVGLLTMAAVHGREPFGVLDLDGSRVDRLKEKPLDRDRWINGGLFVVDPAVFDELTDPTADWETGPVQRLVARGQAYAHRHEGWWECVDRPDDLPFVERAVAAASSGLRPFGSP